MGLTRRVTLPLLVTGLALGSAAGASAPFGDTPTVLVHQQSEPSEPDDTDDTGDTPGASEGSFDFSSVFVDLSADTVSGDPFFRYFYSFDPDLPELSAPYADRIAGSPPNEELVSEFLGVLDTQVGGFVVPGDRCDEDVIAAFDEQELQAVTAAVEFSDGTTADVPVALVAATVVDPTAQASATYQTAWRRCLEVSAEETTDAAEGTVAGMRSFNLYRQHRADDLRVDIDLVTWSEQGLEIMVFSTFALESGGTRAALETEMSPAEPGLEIARAIAQRTHEPTELLLDEATSPVPTFAYGARSPGVESRVRYALRQHARDQGMLPAADPTVLVRNAAEFEVTPEFSGLAQVVVWDPAYLNRPGFRTGWLDGLRASAEGDVVTPTREGARLYARYTSESIEHAAWITECYTFAISGIDADVIDDIATEALLAQVEAREAVFGITGPVTPAEGEDAGEADAEALRDERNEALCSETNLRLFQSGFPTDDTDGDGIADRVEDAP